MPGQCSLDRFPKQGFYALVIVSYEAFHRVGFCDEPSHQTTRNTILFGATYKPEEFFRAYSF